MKPIALVADDDPKARSLMSEQLEAADFLVVEAEDGLAAWERFQREDPDLVVTDLRMPRLDGIQLIQRLRSEARSWVPVIVITSHHDPQILGRVFAAGAGGATRFLHLRHDLDRLGQVAREVLVRDLSKIREQQRLLKTQDIATLMNECQGNVSEVARQMGVTRKTVYNRLRDAGLDRGLERPRTRDS